MRVAVVCAKSQSLFIPPSEVFSLFYEPGERKGSVAVLYRFYFDDTADQKQQKYVVAAGLLGRVKTWTKFHNEWKKVLRVAPSIEFFHSKEWRGLDGEFRQFRDPIKWPKPQGGVAANTKREKLKRVIENTELVAIGMGVLVEDFNLVRNADPRAANFFREDPYEGALQSVVYECAKATRKVSRADGLGDNGHCVGYISDLSEQAPIYTEIYRDFVKKNPDIGQIMRGITHLDDKKWPALQAADMVAHITNQVFKQLIAVPEDERALLKSLPELQRNFFKIAHMDKWYMCSILEDLVGVSLFDKLGIARRAYMSDEELENEKLRGKILIRPERKF
jgi:Protein of unknown function (DUF3800)